MSQSRSLTSLRDEFQPSSGTDFERLSSDEKDKVFLAEIRGEIEILTRKKNDLEDDIDRLTDAKQFAIDKVKNATENRRLRIEKKRLLGQIHQLGKVYFGLKEGSKKIEEAMGGVTLDRIKTLEVIGAGVSADLKREAEKLRLKAEKSASYDDFLLGISDYYVQYASILEARLENIITRESEMVQREAEARRIDKLVAGRAQEAEDMHTKAEGRLGTIDSLYKSIDKDTKWFENEAEKERARVELREKVANRRERVAEAKIKENKKFEKELDKREGWLDDRTKTLGRTIKRLGLEKML